MGYIPGKWSGVTIGAGVETLSKAFVARHLAVVEDYAQKMDQRAVNVLVSLRHFAGEHEGSCAGKER